MSFPGARVDAGRGHDLPVEVYNCHGGRLPLLRCGKGHEDDQLQERGKAVDNPQNENPENGRTER